MVVSFNQPAFIPWGGFFARLMVSDTMVLLDETQFARGFTFVNRNRVKGPEQEVWLTVPLEKKGRGRQKINQLQIYNKEFWSEKFSATLYHMYGRSVFFDDIALPLARVACEAERSFVGMARQMLDMMRREMKIESGFTRQSDLEVAGTGIQLLVAIARELKAAEVILPFGAQNNLDCRQLEEMGVKVWLSTFEQEVYPQFWGRFRANLSALDLLLCLGPESKRILQRSNHLVEFVSS